MKVFRRICILLVVVALIVAMPLSAFAASASQTVPYNGYSYSCYSQCGASTAYASIETTNSAAMVRVYSVVYNNSILMYDQNSGYSQYTADVYFSGLSGHTKLVSEHYVSDADGIVRLLTQTALR